MSEAAEENHRSMTAEIIARLERSFDAPSQWTDRDRAWFINQMQQQVIKHANEWTHEQDADAKMKELQDEERRLLSQTRS